MALEYLLVEDTPNLIRLSREDRENMFPRLSTLHIFKCPKLMDLHSYPSLNFLHITGECNKDLLSSIHKLSSRGSLLFVSNKELTCFPDEMLQNLTSIQENSIYCCKGCILSRN